MDQAKTTINDLNDVIQTGPLIQHHKIEKKAKTEKILKIKYDSVQPKHNRKQVSVQFSLIKTRRFYEKDMSENSNHTVRGRQFLAALKDSNDVAELEFQRHLSKKDFEKARYTNTAFLLILLHILV